MKQKRATKSSWWVRLLKFSALMSVLVVILIAGYLVYLDRTITGTFEGRRWSVPAQVFAQPIELHPGASISARALRTELERLGYQTDLALRTPGTFRIHQTGIDVHLRAFDFLEGSRPSQTIHVQFVDARISHIYRPTPAGDEDVPLIRQQPCAPSRGGGR